MVKKRIPPPIARRHRRDLQSAGALRRAAARHPGRAVYAVLAKKGAERRELTAHRARRGEAARPHPRHPPAEPRRAGARPTRPASALVAIRPSDGSRSLPPPTAPGPAARTTPPSASSRPAPPSVGDLLACSPGSPVLAGALHADHHRQRQAVQELPDYPPPRSAPSRPGGHRPVLQHRAHQRPRPGEGRRPRVGCREPRARHRPRPRLPAHFGEVPDPASETEAAADLIGQGKVPRLPDGDGDGDREHPGRHHRRTPTRRRDRRLRPQGGHAAHRHRGPPAQGAAAPRRHRRQRRGLADLPGVR